MSLIQMSISGAIMVLEVIVIRALAINRLPKKTFIALGGIVMIACVLFFAISYFKCRREFRESLPIKSDFLTKWLNQHHIHWFNPLVWAMYILANRDIELSCDETIVRSFGEPIKSAYALTLISMEETKNSLTPLCNNFSKNAIEERITAIMKLKKTSRIALLAAFGLIIGVTATLATSAAVLDKKTTSLPNTNFSQSEYDQLLALRFDGYEKMTIQEYQQKVWTRGQKSLLRSTKIRNWWD